MQKDQMHVGGRWLDAADGEVFESANPYTGKPRALIPRGRAAAAERLARIEVTDNGKLISETLD
jgi:(Z)-2-((N-methylformamido)methylene)-5-hydroxybutyrolactone dehydrogenase